MVKTLFARLLMFVLIPSTAFAALNQVELTFESPGAITVPVTINGQGPFVFMLDTGSNRSIVRSDLAARLALPVVAKAAMVTWTGRQEYPIVRMDRVVIGDAAGTAVLASVIPGSQLESGRRENRRRRRSGLPVAVQLYARLSEAAFELGCRSSRRRA